jgi:large conductance mechanosensitive channel
MEQTVGIMQEFKDFAMRGNVVDLAVGVIMGAAFAPIVGSLVDNVIMPPIGLAMAGLDFSALKLVMQAADPVKKIPEVAIGYGLFLNAIIKFVITAFAIFMLVKAMNSMKKPAAAAEAPPPPPSEVYLKEIRDALVKK